MGMAAALEAGNPANCPMSAAEQDEYVAKHALARDIVRDDPYLAPTTVWPQRAWHEGYDGRGQPSGRFFPPRLAAPADTTISWDVEPLHYHRDPWVSDYRRQHNRPAAFLTSAERILDAILDADDVWDRHEASWQLHRLLDVDLDLALL